MDYETLNRMLESRVKDLASARPPRRRLDHAERIRVQKVLLAKTLGLHPEPPRTELRAQITGTIHREGYRIEKLRYESRPGLLVTAHLYLPEKEGPHPLILAPHGHWEFKKSTPVVQAHGIGLALLGFACMIVDSPGKSWDDNDRNERRDIGTHDDPWLAMGAPVAGEYVWDLVRGLDYASTRPDIDMTKIGITGASGGGQAAMLAFAFDDRIAAAVPVCQCVSFESNVHYGCFCNHIPGAMEIGDRADLLAIRAPAPIMLIGASDDQEFPQEGHVKTFDKLRSIYKIYKKDELIRLEIVEGKHDYNRRMREAMYAFFAEHLQGQPKRGHIPEPRPLTDGSNNPYEAGTEPAMSDELLVTTPDQRTVVTFREILEKGFEEPYPEDFVAEKRLAPWAKYGRIELTPAAEIVLADTATPGALTLDPDRLDIRLLIFLGLSPAEFVAQVLHLHLPGKPETWEPNALGADAISSMIASVKTLVKGAEEAKALKHVKAEGPFASMVAGHLHLLRPQVTIETSHAPKGWRELYETQNTALLQPNAKYLKWPF